MRSCVFTGHSLRGAAVLVLAAAIAMLGTARARAATLPIADGQLFLVKLSTAQPAASAVSNFIPACDSATRTRIEQLAFQFAFQRRQDVLSVTISVTGSVLSGTQPTPIGDPAALDRVRIDASPSLTLTLSSPLTATAGGDGRASAIALPTITGDAQMIAGDQVFDCVIAGSGKGLPDTTPPQVQFAKNCRDAAASPAPCLLLPEGEVRLEFSKPVVLAGAAALLSAVDGNGRSVALLPDLSRDPVAAGLSVYGYWPLGGRVTLTLAPGTRDTAGNAASTAVSQTFTVAADPGDLPDLGFESGTLAGYTVQTLTDYREGLFDQALFLAESGLPPQLAAQVVSSFRGLLPTEGGFMAAIDNGQNCQVGEVALVARLTVPAGSVALVLDDNLVRRTGSEPDGAQAMVTATVRSDGEFRTVTQTQPAAGEMQPLDDQSEYSDWQQLAIPVDGLGGQDIILTLRLRPSVVMAPPPLCIQGTLLLDYLRFH